MSEVEVAYSSFADWLNRQNCWLRDAIWRIYNHQKIDDSLIHQYAEMCLAESQGIKGIKYHHMEAKKVLPQSTPIQMKIKRLYEIEGVNDLGKNTKLSFLMKV